MSKKNKKGFYDHLEFVSKNLGNIAKIGSVALMTAASTYLYEKVTKKRSK